MRILRAEQLQHRHLLTEERLGGGLVQAGFTTVQTTPYLSARMCEIWDRVDGPLCMGAGPLTLGRAYRCRAAVHARSLSVATESSMATLLYKSAPGGSGGDALCDADPGQGVLRTPAASAPQPAI